MRTHLTQVLEREQRYLDAQDQPRVRSKALGDSSFATISPWLERTQWHIVYQNVRRDILRAMTQLPSSGVCPAPAADYDLGQGLCQEIRILLFPGKMNRRSHVSRVPSTSSLTSVRRQHGIQVEVCSVGSGAHSFSLASQSHLSSSFRIAVDRDTGAYGNGS